MSAESGDRASGKEKTPAVQVIDLTKVYGPVTALDSISFTLERGAALLVLGPNGSGKSTLIKILCGLLGYRAPGTVRVLGYEPRSQRAKLFEHARAAFEDHGFIDAATGWEHLELFANLRGLDPLAQLEAASSAFGLGSFLGRRTGDYSSGMKRKLALAQAFMGRPELIMLDEPFVALDRASRNLLIEMLSEERKRGTTLIISSHILVGLESIATDVMIMTEGKLRAREKVGLTAGGLEETYRKVLEEN